MVKKFFVILLSFFFLFSVKPVFSKEISSKSLEKYINKISNKFSRTYCNTSKFGISDEGAMEFAIGETNKEFKNNKLNALVDSSLLEEKILNDLENNCQIYAFPIDMLSNLTLE
tara:strand:+ start:269 stop:610 length:342 start_codon:yes stop_codon:yes gene_type:complete